MLFTCTASPRTLSPATSRNRPVKGLERSLQATPPAYCSPRVAPRRAVPTRKMRLSDFCNQRSTREPYGLPDSRLPSRSRSLAGAIPIRADLPSVKDLRQIPGGASLDGEPPASALPQPSRRIVRGRDPDRRRAGHCAVLAEPRSKGSSALRHSTAEFSSACRACDVASDVLCRRPTEAGSDLSIEPARAKPPGPPPRPPRQRRPLRRTRTPSLDECSLPRSGSAELAARAALPASPAEAFASVPRSVRTEGAGSSRARHRARGFATTSRLRTSFHHPRTRPGG
jgi:hypothetical protein